MRVTVYQFSTIWMKPEENLAWIGKVCNEISGLSDLLILPEMFNTGYTMKPHEIPVQWQDETIQTLTSLASRYHLTICCSIPMFKNNRWYNTMVTVSKDGLIHSYDKIHLFTPAGEKEVYSAGDVTTTCMLKYWKIQPLICYDLRFPYLTFNSNQADIIIYSANWPVARVSHWKALLAARAIENQCYVIGVNRTGIDENGYEYPGASTVVDYSGAILLEMNESEGFFTVHVSKNDMFQYREKLPFYRDKINFKPS
jgi:omega-amidase